ncbi:MULTISPECIES: helix-turn-helix domain-containing protein [unclassified Streptomyces]|uniref:helix-turn-helix domain-containing protein n=1 Tax=unclassified Streptomyces TaxID=2593676 RepID=UPI002E2A955A|nr:helix-turn-helix domain-containing protein [Streptomyces sp. NBC_00272]
MTASVEEPRLPSPEERRRLREAADLTYEDVATAVGVTVTTVRSWESGRTGPRGRKREAYALFLASLEPQPPVAATAPEPTPDPTPDLTPDLTPTPTPALGLGPAPAVTPPQGPVAEPAGEAAAAPGPAMADATSSTGPDAAALWRAGAYRPFGMGGHGQQPLSPPLAGPAAPRRGAELTANATAGGIGTPGPGTSWSPVRLPDLPHALALPDRAPVPATPYGPEPTPAPAAPASAPDPASDPEGAAPDPVESVPAPPGPERPPGPREVFDAMYDYAAPALTRQAYLLTGRRRLSHEAVEQAFQQAWARWPEVAVDPDPVGWVRAAVYEYALSPWHRFRRAHKHPDKAPADPADRILMDAMLALPAAHRRTVLLYDGVGLDLPDTAAETEASTPTAGNRLLHAHAALADRIPELAAAPPGKESAVLRERLGSVTPAVRLEPRPAAAVRMAAEQRATRWTRAFLGLTAVIAVATAYTTVTAPRQYEPPVAPGASVSGVPPLSGPQRLTEETRQLHAKLRAHPAHKPNRLAPSLG